MIVIVATEQSGDNYGALLAREFRRRQPGVRLIGLGGPQMQAAGVELLQNMLEHSATGILEVLGSVRFFLKAMDRVVHTAIREKARACVLIDSPDFNLRIAGRIKRAGIPVSYYVSPQVWAWRSGRVRKIRRDTDEVMAILPFEVDWYRERGTEVHFVGHPTLDRIDVESVRRDGMKLRSELLGSGAGPLIGLLPGSRRNEIERLMDRFLTASALIAEERPTARFVLACSEWLNPTRVESFLSQARESLAAKGMKLPEVTALHRSAKEVMAACDALWCCSGTATLEAALIGTPMLMTYRVSAGSAWIARRIFKEGDLFCLPNIILGEKVIPELLQEQTEAEILKSEMLALLHGGGTVMREKLARLPGLLGGPGASARAAERVLQLAGLA